MTRRPPIPTLFPYTTLCRPGAVEVKVRLGPDQALRHDPGARAQAARAGPVGVHQEHGGGPVGDLRRGTRRADRKSTRLNSRLANISYAVFCLDNYMKKKTSI